MSLSRKDENRRNELVRRGERGATNDELHNLNVRNNRSRNDNELWDAARTRSDGGPQARAELRRRGYKA